MLDVATFNQLNPHQCDPLTERQREVLALRGRGLTIRETARSLGLSPGTVKNHITHIYLKLGASNIIEAWRRARERGIIEE